MLTPIILDRSQARHCCPRRHSHRGIPRHTDQHSFGLTTHLLAISGFGLVFYCFSQFLDFVLSIQLFESAKTREEKQSFPESAEEYVEEKSGQQIAGSDLFQITNIDISQSTVIGKYQECEIYDAIIIEFDNGLKKRYTFTNTCDPYADISEVDTTILENGALVLPSGIVYSPEKVC